MNISIFRQFVDSLFLLLKGLPYYIEKDLYHESFDCFAFKYYNYKSKIKDIEFYIKQYLDKDNIIILDIGCGTGNIAKEFYKKGYRVIGIDIDLSMIKIAKMKSKEVDFIVQDANKLGLRKNLADIVIGTHVTFPSDDLRRIFAQAFEILKSGGLIYFDFLLGKLQSDMYYMDYDFAKCNGIEILRLNIYHVRGSGMHFIEWIQVYLREPSSQDPPAYQVKKTNLWYYTNINDILSILPTNIKVIDISIYDEDVLLGLKPGKIVGIKIRTEH